MCNHFWTKVANCETNIPLLLFTIKSLVFDQFDLQCKKNMNEIKTNVFVEPTMQFWCSSWFYDKILNSHHLGVVGDYAKWDRQTH